MTTQIHDSTTCTTGVDGAKCEICRWAVEAARNPAPDPYSLFEPSEGSQGQETANSAVPAVIDTPDFEHEWNAAPRSMRNHVERETAEKWLMRGVWLGIQYERERGLVAMNSDLREMQRMARERVTK